MSSQATVKSEAGEPVIEATGLCKSFGDLAAVRDLRFTVHAGQVVGLLGPNGAGKSTTVNMMTTLMSIDAGSATVGGFDVRSQADVVRQLVGLAGQAAAIDEKLTVRENLRLFGRLYKMPRAALRARIEEMIEQFDLGGFADQPAGTCSGGQRRRLDVVAALIAEPVALFLDEPTTGLDPRSRSEIWQAIEDLAAAGAAIVLTTQYLEEADRLADHVLIIDEGRTVAEGSPESLKAGLRQDVLDVHFADDASFADAVATIGGTRGLVADPEERRLGVAVGDGATRSLDLLMELRTAGVSISDFQLRRPSLDDVFLQITGNQRSTGTSSTTTADPTAGGPRAARSTRRGSGAAEQEKETSR